MSAVAEPILHAHIDDALARRNAMVLAVAQALAGGNNTVIVVTASIVGAMLAPDKGLATLPITAMVIGMWLGTLPVGVLARRYGRRFALQTGSAVRRAVRADLLHGGDAAASSGCCSSAPSAAGSTPPRTSPIGSPPPTPRAKAYRPKVVSWVLAGGVFAAVIGPQLVIFTKDLLSPHMFAASYLGQSACAVLAAMRAASSSRCRRSPRSASRARGRWSRSCARRASSSPSPAAWRATP